MLLIIRSFQDIRIPEILSVYAQTVTTIGREKYRKYPPEEQLQLARQQLLDDLRHFFHGHKSILFVWLADGRYASALHAQLHDGGWLISCLETDLDFRRKGYGSAVVDGAVRYLTDLDCGKIRSHVEKRNKASFALHTACGFAISMDYGKLLDGTVSQYYWTLEHQA